MRQILLQRISKKKIGNWLNDYYGYLPEKAKMKYLKTGVGHAAGCMFPNADQMRLKAACRFFMWAFVIDDTYERGPEDRLKDIRQKALAILRGELAYDGDPELHQVPKIRQELLQCSNDAWMKRFCNSLDVYFDGIIREVPYRVNLEFPNFDEFYEIRERAVNVYPLVDIAEMITGEILPDDIMNNPQIKRISQLTCRILAWANDYFSAHLEKGKDVWNIILMLQNKRQYSIEEAYLEAVAVHDADLAEYCELKDSLPDFGGYHQAVNQFIENLSLMIHGYLFWTNTRTERYHKEGHPSSDLQIDQLLIG
ncbi:terpene synthase family protein [Pedobacter sp.]|jgi:hypothetical protein|uniref:terpene synthase family protein n=1 Tax=Pedobacter sp. TaxID=1411316 RepID=UPI002B9FA95D|nr:hypothetical protein [Pedobacter sp.]HWW37844.1 hypothetical protein [Pedobacter sp.]